MQCVTSPTGCFSIFFRGILSVWMCSAEHFILDLSFSKKIKCYRSDRKKKKWTSRDGAQLRIEIQVSWRHSSSSNNSTLCKLNCFGVFLGGGCFFPPNLFVWVRKRCRHGNPIMSRSKKRVCQVLLNKVWSDSTHPCGPFHSGPEHKNRFVFSEIRWLVIVCVRLTDSSLVPLIGFGLGP